MGSYLFFARKFRKHKPQRQPAKHKQNTYNITKNLAIEIRKGYIGMRSIQNVRGISISTQFNTHRRLFISIDKHPLRPSNLLEVGIIFFRLCYWSPKT